MKLTEQVVRPEHTEEIEVGVKCDLCGRTTLWPGGWRPQVFDEVTIERRTGYRFPDSSDVAVVAVDLCPQCFETRLLPWLHSQGAESRCSRAEWDL